MSAQIIQMDWDKELQYFTQEQKKESNQIKK